MNYMKDVAKMLGVKLGEEPKIKGNLCSYRSKEDDFLPIHIIVGADEIINLPKQILTNKEKEYLSTVIKPFRENIEYIVKYHHNCYEDYLMFKYTYEGIDGVPTFTLPYFKINAMYKGMAVGRRYTLEELNL